MNVRKPVICIGPNVAIDHTVVIPAYDSGAVLRTARSSLVAGGKSLNVARALKTLGQAPLAMGMLGGPSGEMIAALASEEGIEARWVDIAGDSRVCVMVVESDTGEATAINETGPTITKEEWSRFTAAIFDEANRAEALCLSGSQPPGVPLDAYGELVRKLRDLGTMVLVDTHSEGLASAAAAGPHVLKANGDEVSGLLGRPVASMEHAAVAAEELRGGRLIEVIVTMGRHGAVVSHAGGVLTGSPPPLDTVNSVGSGDAFLAGYIAATIGGEGVPEALRHGIAAGAANALSPWGAAFSLDDHARLLGLIDIA